MVQSHRQVSVETRNFPGIGAEQNRKNPGSFRIRSFFVPGKFRFHYKFRIRSGFVPFAFRFYGE